MEYIQEKFNRLPVNSGNNRSRRRRLSMRDGGVISMLIAIDFPLYRDQHIAIRKFHRDSYYS
ncbi:MAG: hypothetical protein ABI876_12100 [Bacteroidota bacterium]